LTAYGLRITVHCLGLVLLGLLATGGVARAQEPPAPTATPDAEGVIYVEVQPNDSLWSIAARAGLTLAELLALNGLTESAVIRPGDRLIIGYGTPPATPTVPPLPTATLPPPTPRPTVQPPRTALCLAAYDDQNRNGLFDAGEALRPAVAFTIFDETAVVANYVTDGVNEPHCIEGLRGGAYHITRSLAPDEVLTNDGNWRLTLAAGDVARLDFGSYRRLPMTETAAAETAGPATVAAPTPRPAGVETAVAPTPAAAAAESPTAPRNTTAFLAAGLVVMILLVAVLFLLIWRRVRP
ncbi:MAG: LysM peptidoglycan-binding domain-containing protein, partial [Anaerolineales bacterium]|nr:LysM peptidoglycan-binding domain-containing protein [Anaerolineales bacterium]